MGYAIRHDYHAIRDSGYRTLASIDWFVLHDMENADPDDAAEETGAWFENRAVQASTHYGIDNDSIQQYLGINVIPWGAPGANKNGIHIEQMGKASWTRAQWLAKAKPTLKRTAWLLSRLHDRLARQHVIVPLRTLTDEEVRRKKHGVVTHRQLTRALGVGSHTDPGTGYPLDWVLRKAREYEQT